MIFAPPTRMFFVVPGPPPAWRRAGEQIRYKRAGFCGRRPYIHHFDPPENRRNKKRIAAAFLAARPRGWRMLTGPVALSVVGWFEAPRSWSRARRLFSHHHTAKPDDDNLRKIVADALTGLAWKDDAQIAVARIEKRLATADADDPSTGSGSSGKGPGERTEITITRLADWREIMGDYWERFGEGALKDLLKRQRKG